MLVIMAFPMLIAFLGHGLFASSYLSFFVSIPFCIFIGAVLAYDTRTIGMNFPIKEISIGLVFLMTWGLYFAQLPYLKGVRGASDNSWKTTISSLDLAVTGFPISPLFNREAGYAHAEAATDGNLEELSIAIERFKKATEVD